MEFKGLSKFLAAAFSAAALSAGGAAQADYPEKPVEMTVLFGGTANTIAQLLAELMSKNLGEPVVPVSRTGGGGAVGYSFVVGTAPDGYNIVWNSNSINTTAHTGTVPFDYTAFAPIARISTEIPALAVNADTGWKSLEEMKAAVEASGQKLKVGISGKGSFTHLTSAALFDALGLGEQVTFISYGQGKAPVELLAGRIDAAIQWPGQFVSYVDAGKLNVLAVTGAERVAVLPDVATAQEQGVDIDISMWRGLAAPTGTPDAVIGKLQAAAEAAVADEKFAEAAANIGFTPAFLNAGDFGALIASDDQFYADLLARLGLAK
ncbi:MAG: Bug family tripartite tricarboxylate transporter substrate binding protein [Tropicimonas sp.]|uniref:Bug family tripartite tricarboxylate transporter substrate binding protein n=1 Tax=Tropicimonas sp. TaxID=2067044 RepID=UPI003A8B9E27